MHSERIAAALDGARWVKYDCNGYLLAWFGAHGLHVFDARTGVEVDYLSVGDFGRASATESEIADAALRWIGEGRERPQQGYLLYLATCQECSGTRVVPAIFGNYVLCDACTVLPREPDWTSSEGPSDLDL